MIEITSKWLHDNSTRGGGWTAKQLRVLGVQWPPRRGWLADLIGQRMTPAQKADFEAHHQNQQARLRLKHDLPAALKRDLAAMDVTYDTSD